MDLGLPAGLITIMRKCREEFVTVIRSRTEMRADMKALGRDLLLAKEMCPASQWRASLEEYGIHYKTAQRAMRIAQGLPPRARAAGPVVPSENYWNPKNPGALGAGDEIPLEPLGEDFEPGEDEEEEDGPGAGTVVDGADRVLGAAGPQLELGVIYRERARAAIAAIERGMHRLEERAAAGSEAAAVELEELAARIGGGV